MSLGATPFILLSLLDLLVFLVSVGHFTIKSDPSLQAILPVHFDFAFLLTIDSVLCPVPPTGSTVSDLDLLSCLAPRHFAFDTDLFLDNNCPPPPLSPSLPPPSLEFFASSSFSLSNINSTLHSSSLTSF
jgi:hypothetical protein